MGEDTKAPLGAPLAIYVAFIFFVGVANIVWGGDPASAPEGRAFAGGALLFIGAVTLVGMAAPLWLAARGRLTLPLWPTPGTGDNALAVLLVVFLFARVEMLGAIFAEGRPWGEAAATFVGPAALHLASVTATMGVLLPALKSRMPAAPAAVIVAFAWSAYHLAQFNVFPDGLELRMFVTLTVFGLGYALYYFWSRSLLLTIFLQHLVATTTFIYRRDFAFGEIDPPFYYSLLVLAAFLVFAFVKRRLYAAERFTYF